MAWHVIPTTRVACDPYDTQDHVSVLLRSADAQGMSELALRGAAPSHGIWLRWGVFGVRIGGQDFP
eukprot:364268-Chlamydomonas_euryale.AAC.7